MKPILCTVLKVVKIGVFFKTCFTLAYVKVTMDSVRDTQNMGKDEIIKVL